MQELEGLLISALDQTSFRLGTGDYISPTQFREIYNRTKWNDEKASQSRNAQPGVPQRELIQLMEKVRLVLKDFVDPKSDRVGIAVPAGSTTGVRLHHNGGLTSAEWHPEVEDFTKAAIKGAAALGVERVIGLLCDWLQGKPIVYRTTALLNAPFIGGTLMLAEGIRLTTLPAPTISLFADLPNRYGMTAEEYANRSILSIETTVSPPLFRPSSDGSKQNVHAVTKDDVGISTICDALALETNCLFEPAFHWLDYQDLWAFSFGGNTFTWSTENERIRKKPWGPGPRNDSRTDSIELLQEGEKLIFNSVELKIFPTVSALSDAESEKHRLALGRWKTSLDFERNLVDKLIDLRIALESLYDRDSLNDKYRQEKRFRISLIGAWHLGTDYEDRKRIFRQLRNAYDEASRVVHGGDSDRKKAQKVLSDAQDLCRRGILRLLKEGCPSNWLDIILGSEFESC